MVVTKREYLYLFLFWTGTLCCIYEWGFREKFSSDSSIAREELVSGPSAEEDPPVQPIVLKENLQKPKVIEYYHKVVKPNAKNLKKIFKDFSISWADTTLKRSGLNQIKDPDRVFLSLKREDNKVTLCEARYYSSADVCYIIKPHKKSVIKKNCRRVAKRVSGVINKSFNHSLRPYNVPASVFKDCLTGLQKCANVKSTAKKGYKFDILYTAVQMPNGEKLFPKFKYAALNDKHKVYLFNHPGISAEYYNEHGKFLGTDKIKAPIRTVAAKVGSRFGMRVHPISYRRQMHYGVDFNAPRGTPVYSVAPGKVIKAGYNAGFGKAVEVQHAQFVTRYAHLHAIKVQPGDTVTDNTVLGTVGATGYTTGVHLHFEIEKNKTKVDPLKVHSFGNKDLTGAVLKQFVHYKKNVDIQLASADVEKVMPKIG